MLNTQADIENDVLVQLNASTTIAFYTETIIDTWISKAHTWADVGDNFDSGSSTQYAFPTGNFASPETQASIYIPFACTAGSVGGKWIASLELDAT